MKKVVAILLKSLLCLFYLALAFFFFFVDFYIFKYVIWPSWQNGSIQLQENLNIFVFSFNDNMAYLPFAIYLIAGIFLMYAFVRLFYRTWLTRS